MHDLIKQPIDWKKTVLRCEERTVFGTKNGDGQTGFTFGKRCAWDRKKTVLRFKKIKWFWASSLEHWFQAKKFWYS